MTPILYSLPYDRTGTLPRNRVVNEYHDLTQQAGLRYRTFVLDHGYFYTDAIEVMDSSGYHLKEDEDFQCITTSADANQDTGKETAAVIVIVNPRVTAEVYVNASMVGGPYCNLAPAIAQTAAGLLNPTRNPLWRNITGKPDKFEVGGHLHAMWELYGFEGYCEALDRITDARLLISAKAYEVIRKDYDGKVGLLEDGLAKLMQDLATHIAQPNPHEVNKNQIGLSDVLNYSVITAAEATTRGFNSQQRYLVVGRYKEMIDANFTVDLTAHINNTQNPHQVTAGQANTRTIPEANVELNKKLGKTETAISTHRIQGALYPAFYTTVRSNLNADNINSSIVNIQRICATPDIGSNHGIVGNNQARLLSEMIIPLAKQGTKIVYLAGANGQNIPVVLASTFNDNSLYPVGTIALAMEYYHHSVGYGNGAFTAALWRLKAYVKTASTTWAFL